MGVEQACESMQDDWKRLLLRVRGSVVQQARASVGCVQVRPYHIFKQSILTIIPEAAAACLLL